MGCASSKSKETSVFDNIKGLMNETLSLIECIILLYIRENQMKLVIKMLKVREILAEYFAKNESDRDRIQKLYKKLLICNQFVYENEMEKELSQLKSICDHFKRTFKRACKISFYSATFLEKVRDELKESDSIYLKYRHILSLYNQGTKENLSAKEIILRTYCSDLNNEEDKIISKICKGSTYFIKKRKETINYDKILMARELQDTSTEDTPQKETVKRINGRRHTAM